jgi:hypothetical protein
MKNVLIAVLSGIAWLSVGCGGVVEEPLDESNLPAEVAPVSEDDLGKSKGALVNCGWSCPAGYHIVSWTWTAGCGSSGTCSNSVNCEPNTGSFYSCGNCPSGWRATSYSCDYSCFGCSQGCWGASNKSYCVPN